MLEKYDRGASNNVYKIVTGDESGIYAYEPETEGQPTVWVFEDEPNPTKLVRGRSTSKQMVVSFFGKTGHVATVPLEYCRTVSSEWYIIIFLFAYFKDSLIYNLCIFRLGHFINILTYISFSYV